MGAFDGLRGGQISHGYWGPHTGTIDWCESNYSHTPYIAETYNTVTNIPVILAGIYGALATYFAGINKRYAVCYLGLSFIGIGSTGFHASLRWEWQLLDELPMIYVVSYAALMVLDTLPGFKPRYGIWGYLVLTAWCLFVTFSYLYLPNPVYHQVAFAAILLGTTARNVTLIRRLPSAHPGRKLVTRYMAWGIFTFAAGFGIWNLDNIFCTYLRSWRELLGIWGFLLEGHAYWHLMTGFGSFWIFTAAIYLQLAIKVSPEAYTFDGNAWLPTVRPTVPAKSAVVVVDKKGEVVGTGETLVDVKEKSKEQDGKQNGH
ncbi:ceramidase-domain-containing protein [Naematelia encephala]|uniref:Ceramidase-domain-containing protein n=1 Tax=Naematelia encephala TaxID=71784 RepID=A0A1Y2BA84_9TREE|nr:ceramidase-domain-containing protein [Naematelia encephala]